MVGISSPFSADKAVRISRAGIFDKGTQPKLCRKKAKLPYKSGCQIFFMPGSFEF